MSAKHKHRELSQVTTLQDFNHTSPWLKLKENIVILGLHRIFLITFTYNHSTAWKYWDVKLRIAHLNQGLVEITDLISLQLCRCWTPIYTYIHTYIQKNLYSAIVEKSNQKRWMTLSRTKCYHRPRGKVRSLTETWRMQKNQWSGGKVWVSSKQMELTQRRLVMQSWS